LKDTTTGDSLCDEKIHVILESMNFPNQLSKLRLSLNLKLTKIKWVSRYRNFLKKILLSVLPQTRNWSNIIAGMGELHLDIIVDRMRREFKVEATVGAPQVSYRETFRQTVQSEGKFVRQSGGKGQFGHVWVEFTPNEEGAGFAFENAIVGGVVPREYIPAVEAGLKDAMENGVLGWLPFS
jgi:elongation factor G